MIYATDPEHALENVSEWQVRHVHFIFLDLEMSVIKVDCVGVRKDVPMG